MKSVDEVLEAIAAAPSITEHEQVLSEAIALLHSMNTSQAHTVIDQTRRLLRVKSYCTDARAKCVANDGSGSPAVPIWVLDVEAILAGGAIPLTSNTEETA